MKISVVVLCTSLLPVGLVFSLGPSNDRKQAPELLAQAQAVSRPTTPYADRGYDAEWIHVQCREQWDLQSIIPSLGQRADGTRNGRWRSQMNEEHLRERQHGRHWTVESFFSALKRIMGEPWPAGARTKCWRKPPLKYSPPPLGEAATFRWFQLSKPPVRPKRQLLFNLTEMGKAAALPDHL